MPNISKSRFFLLITAVIVLLLCQNGMNAFQAGLEKHEFNITPGEKFILEFAVQSPGRISINARWEGSNEVFLTLYKPGGKLQTKKEGISPLKIEFMLSNRLFQSGGEWKIVLENFGVQEARGTLTISSPGTPDQRPKKGWCCLNGKVHPVTESECRESGGLFFSRKREAEKFCREEHPEPGWCCLDGRVTLFTEAECVKRSGRFFPTREEAEEHCREERPRPEEGWCCKNGEVFPATEENCRRQGGEFFPTRREARKFCREKIRDKEQEEHVIPDFPLIEQAVQSVQIYYFRVEYDPGLFYEGEIDLAENRQHIFLGITSEDKHIAEVFFEGDKGYGRRFDRENWLEIQARPIPNDPRQVLDYLREAEIGSVHEEEQFWVLEIIPGDIPALRDPETFYQDIFSRFPCCQDVTFMEKVTAFARDLSLRMEIRISREDHLIHHVMIHSMAPGLSSEMRISFLPAQEVPPFHMDFEGEITTSTTMEMLLFDLDTIAGWNENRNHAPWAERSLKLIKDKDKEGKYSEIYDSSWANEIYTEKVAKASTNPDHKKHHPLVLGTYYEDQTDPMPQFFGDWFKTDSNYQKNKGYYWNTGGYMRDYQHFGQNGKGLEKRWFFIFRGTPPNTNLPGDRYYHCRDWGFGYGRINENLNRLTWTEAIKQYNSYTFEGKRRAYLMLGFVTHLLQDQGHPDHANNFAHPGSGMDEKQAYTKYNYCHLIAAEAAVVAAAACSSTGFGIFISAFCAGGTYGIAYGACRSTIDSNEMGHEKLIAEKYDVSRIDKPIQKKGIIKKQNYNAFFDDLGLNAGKEMQKAGLNSILGCGTLYVPPVAIPGADPDIQSDDPKAVKPYFEMTDSIVTNIVSYSAGLIEHFYEIVNYPPFVKRLAIVQWEPLDTPRGFAFFAKDKNHCIRYDAEWVIQSGKRVLINRVKPQSLSLDRPAYLFVQYGPTGIAPITSGRIMKDPKVRVTGINPLKGQPIDFEVKLTDAEDSMLGQYYWGAFNPENCGKDPYYLFFEVTAKDQSAHFNGRNPSGADIDADPSTLAYVDSTKYPTFPLVDYEPGPDKNHKVQVSTFDWTLDINPSTLVLDPSKGDQGKVVMKIKQKAYDCQWEPMWARVSCPVKWELKQVSRKSPSPKTGKPEDFKIKAFLDERFMGEATLKISVDWQNRDYIPGIYDFEIGYEVGEAPNKYKGTWLIKVELK